MTTRSALGIAKMRANLIAHADQLVHGDRQRYLAGCRCEDCTEGNTAYMRELRARHRAGIRVGTLAPASRARRHLRYLQKHDVGLRAVAECAKVPRSTLQAIKNGDKLHVRVTTEQRILGVTRAQASDGAVVPAAKTWRLIDELVEEGYTKSFIAKGLGFKGRGIVLSKTHVTVRNAAKVERLHRRLTT